GYFFINIMGLAVGMACCILILLWVQDELSYDTFHENSESIYRIASSGAYFEWIDGTPAPLGPAISAEIPEIIHSVRFSEVPRMLFTAGEKVFYEDGLILVDSSFFEVFTFPFLLGNSGNVFSEPFNIVITNSMARKYFGDDDPIGKTLEIEGNPTVVSGVLKDIPYNSHLQFDFVASFKLTEIVGTFSTHWGAFNFVTYVQLQEGSNLNEVHLKMTDIALKNECPQVKDGVGFYLQHLSELHLDYRNNYRSYGDIGDSRIVYSFSIIALVIMLIACINYINLSTARSSNRAKEVGMRKTIGANRIQLINQFLSESVLLALFSLIVAVVIMELFLPFFNQLS
ncbi:MAG: ABC transporter permease, partial [candidate division Zixibacteria bacterium]|nr:ABC transporter permease [candidate division Zixibacteria bacterium]